MLRGGRAAVPLLFLLATFLLFHDYFPPFKEVILWGDIEGYHWPLLSYAHASLREGRLPLWDPSIYSGVPFAANIQAGLFYPPNWLLFTVYSGSSRLPFSAMELLSVLHVWLACVFAYFWLRERSTGSLPAVLGACAAGFSGYMLSQMQHLGVTCGYAWIPLGLWGIEQAHRDAHWRPLWKLVVALSLCLLAGYPPTFAAFCLLTLLYAASLPSRKRLVLPVVAAVIAALALSAVQLLPTMEAIQYKVTEVSYGTPVPDRPHFYLSFLLPNYYDQNRSGPGPEVPQADYMYVGSAALFGLIYSLRKPVRSTWLPALLILSVFLLIVEDPYGLLSDLILRLPVLPDVLRSFNLLVAIPFVAALFAAFGAEAALNQRPRWESRRYVPYVRSALVLAWTVYLVFVSRKGTPEFEAGLASAVYAVVAVALVWMGLRLVRPFSGVSAALLLLLLFAEYRCFGVNRKFNATDGNTDTFYKGDVRLGGRSLNGLEDPVYRRLLAHPDYRVALLDGPVATDLRFYGLATPQGFDPFLSKAYKAFVERLVPFRTNREFGFDIDDPEAMQAFGVGYIIVLRESVQARRLLSDPGYELLQPAYSFFQVFRLRDANPAWVFAGGSGTMVAWRPEERQFRVQSNAGGTFVLLEQWFPGWSASINGRPAPVARKDGVFQQIAVPPGVHSVSFRYRPSSVAVGAAISSLTLAGMVVVLRRRGRSRITTGEPVRALAAER